MHFTPAQVRAMSLYEFAACVDGVNRANAVDPAPIPPSHDEFAAAKRAHGII